MPSNDLSVFTPEFWTAEMQLLFVKECVALALANTELRADLKVGDTVHKPYRSRPIAKTYIKGVDIEVEDRKGIDEYLTVDTAKIVPFYVDDIDRIQNKWDMATKYAQDAMKLLNIILDQVVANDGKNNAASSIDDGDVGGTAGNPIALSTSVVHQVFTASGRKLSQFDVPEGNRFSLCGPRTLEQLRLYLAGKDTPMADIVGRNGLVTERFGFEIYYSNNVPYSATLGMATNPTANDTVTISGVTFKFVSAIGTDPGNVLIETAVADSRTNLLNAINKGAGAGTKYVEVSNDNRWKLTKNNVVGVVNGNNVDITANGEISVAETLTAAADVWSAQYSYLLMGMKKATDLVVQQAPNVEFRVAEKRLGRYCYPWMLYGVKTFTDMKDALCAVKLDASKW